MIAFWIAAALLSAAVAVLIVLNAARAAEGKPAEDPTLAVYRRQLSEIDDLSERGLLPDGERRSAHAEAARRLLAAADAPPSSEPDRRIGRLAVFIGAACAPVLALLLYLLVGQPQTPDQPFARRLVVWTQEARSGDAAGRLAPAELAAVLRQVAAQRPTDPVALVYLAHAEVEAGDPLAAEQDLKKAIVLDPTRGQLWELLGETLTMRAGDDPSPEANAAFERALALDPNQPVARFYIGRAKIAAGDLAGGLADWNAAVTMFPAADASRAALQRDIAIVTKTGGLPVSAQAQDTSDQQAMIRAMVARLAAKLKAQPDDPEGWGRLIRSYAVLGDAADRTAAQNAAYAEFKGRPDALARVEQAESAPQ
jgi:cytochrome c-type biogenesis protein CcmH